MGERWRKHHGGGMNIREKQNFQDICSFVGKLFFPQLPLKLLQNLHVWVSMFDGLFPSALCLKTDA